MTTIKPLDNDNEYLLRSPAEVIFVLKALARKRAAISAYFSDTNDFATVALLSVDAAARVLYFDLSPDQKANLALQATRHIICITTHDKVRVQFDLDGMSATQFEGEPAFRARLPDKLLKLQRRNYYRLSVPYDQTIKCTIPLPDQMPVQVEIMDISIGGIGIIGYTPDVPLQPGTVYENCSLSLPGFGLVVTSLQVRSSFDFMLRSGVHTQRAGCRFLDLSPQTESLIQRYILEQERKYRSRLVDDAR
ncbi:MAG: flagellar brake protein [Chitinivorax sp.]